MSTLEDKVSELVDHIEKLVFRYVMTENTTPHLCGGNFSRQEIKVIHMLGRSGSCNMSEIADHLMLAVSSATSVIDKLVEKNLVSRERSEDDRRIVRVSLTPDGGELYRMARQTRMIMGRGMLGTLSAEEQDCLLDLFRKMTRDLMESGRMEAAELPEESVAASSTR